MLEGSYSVQEVLIRLPKGSLGVPLSFNMFLRYLNLLDSLDSLNSLEPL